MAKTNPISDLRNHACNDVRGPSDRSDMAKMAKTNPISDLGDCACNDVQRGHRSVRCRQNGQNEPNFRQGSNSNLECLNVRTTPGKFVRPSRKMRPLPASATTEGVMDGRLRAILGLLVVRTWRGTLNAGYRTAGVVIVSLLVQKFGGTSVADSGKILAAARRAIQAHNRGEQVLVVVSARGHTTD